MIVSKNVLVLTRQTTVENICSAGLTLLAAQSLAADAHSKLIRGSAPQQKIPCRGKIALKNLGAQQLHF